MTNKQKNTSSIKTYLLVFIVLLCIVVVSFIINQRLSNHSNKDIIFMKNNVLQINLEGIEIRNVNSEIEKFYQEYGNDSITYQYSKNNDILSLIITIKTIDEYDIPLTIFKSYNINIKSGTLYTNDEVIAMFDKTLQDVSNSIETVLKYYYQDELEQGYLKQETCDYKCFLNLRGIKNYTDDVQYFIEDGQLIAYKQFYEESIYYEENYFSDGSHQIMLTEG